MEALADLRLGWEDPLEEGMENPMDRGAWWATVHRVTLGVALESLQGLRDLT